MYLFCGGRGRSPDGGTADMTERRASWFVLGLERGIVFGKRMTNKTKIMLLYNFSALHRGA